MGIVLTLVPESAVILLHTVMASPETHLMKNHESQLEKKGV